MSVGSFLKTAFTSAVEGVQKAAKMTGAALNHAITKVSEGSANVYRQAAEWLFSPQPVMAFAPAYAPALRR